MISEELEATRDVTSQITALGHNDASVRKSASKALGEIGDARAVEPLLIALRDSDFSVVSEAARALGRIGAPAVEPPLTALKDADSSVRSGAARALYNMRECQARAVEPLIAALKDADRSVRYWATSALGEVGDARAVFPLMVVLKGKDERLRARAAEALGKIGDAVAAKSLSTAMEDDDEGVRREAARALEKLGVRPDEAKVHVKGREQRITPLIEAVQKQADMNLLQLYFSPRGRIGRRTFLLKGVLVWVVVATVVLALWYALMDRLGVNQDEVLPTLMFLMIPCVFLYVWVMLVTKRLHDINFSGWYQLVILFPILYLLYVVMCCVMKEKPEAIRFGETAY